MPEGLAKTIGQGFRDKDKVVSRVSRFLMHERGKADPGAEHHRRGIYPSEMAKGDAWCGRATYYRLMGAPREDLPLSLAMELVFEEGNYAHNKWQNWLWWMGVLWGTWQCRWCGLVWEDTSPYECPRCEVGMDLIKYREVPFSNDEYMIVGRADGYDASISKPLEVLANH